MSRNKGFISYAPNPLAGETSAQLAAALQLELLDVAATFDRIGSGLFVPPRYESPDKVRALMLVYADGVHWDPHSGEGLYIRSLDNTRWIFLGGFLLYWTEARSVAAPNATTPVHSWTPKGTETNISAAVCPKGTGGLLADVPDNTADGGNKRGNYSVDWQTRRTSATEVASGAQSVIGGGGFNTASNTFATVAGGGQNTASGNSSSVGGGFDNVASADYATIGGGNVNRASAEYSTIAGGNLNTASGTHSAVGGGEFNQATGDFSCIPGGRDANTRGLYGAFAYASTLFSDIGDAQHMLNVLNKTTTDATPAVLTTDSGTAGTARLLSLPDYSSYVVKGLLVARQAGVDATSSWEFTAHIKRGAGAASTVLVAACTPALIAADTSAAAWMVTVTANTTYGALVVTVTGEALKTIRWVCTLQSTQVVCAA